MSIASARSWTFQPCWFQRWTPCVQNTSWTSSPNTMHLWRILSKPCVAGIINFFFLKLWLLFDSLQSFFFWAWMSCFISSAGTSFGWFISSSGDANAAGFQVQYVGRRVGKDQWACACVDAALSWTQQLPNKGWSSWKSLRYHHDLWFHCLQYFIYSLPLPTSGLFFQDFWFQRRRLATFNSSRNFIPDAPVCFSWWPKWIWSKAGEMFLANPKALELKSHEFHII